MTSQLRLEIVYGVRFVQDDDRYRALDAARRVFTEAGIAPDDAWHEYRRQWDITQDNTGLTGLGALWVKAEDAANIALTNGWALPGEAGCSLHL